MGSINLVYDRGNCNRSEVSAMWLVIVGVLSLGLGILALIGLLALARELFCERSYDADFDRRQGTKGPRDVGGRASGDDAR